MAITTILACLTDETGADALMKAACTMARRHDAHLIGLHSIESLIVYPAIAMHVPQAVYQAYGTSQTEQSTALRGIFDRHTRREDFVSEWRLLHSDTETAAERIVESARAADIVMVEGLARDTDNAAHLRLIEAVIRDAGRPVVVVPPEFDGDALGRRVLIGWNASREAARAAHDVLGILQEGDSAHILRIDERRGDSRHDGTAHDLAAACARRGIATTLAERAWETPGVAAALDREAMEVGADMIAVGAFGHSTVYDLFIGAATRSLLTDARIPVLFSR